MENLNDDEIQRVIEEQLKLQESSGNTGVDKDVALYRVLFTELKATPPDTKEYFLADQIVEKLQRKQNQWEQFNYTLIIFVFILSIGSLIFGAAKLMNDDSIKIILRLINNYSSIALFALCSFCTIQILDKYLKRHRPVSKM